MQEMNQFAKTTDGYGSRMPAIEELIDMVNKAKQKVLNAKTDAEYKNAMLEYDSAKAVADCYIYDRDTMEKLS